MTCALLPGRDGTGQVGEDLAGTNHQLGHLGFGQGRVLRLDNGNAAHRCFGAGLAHAHRSARLGVRDGNVLGGLGVEAPRGGLGVGSGGGGALGPGVRRLVGGRGGGEGAEDLRVLGVGLQGGGDQLDRGTGRVEGDVTVREEDRAVGGGRDLRVGRGQDDGAPRRGEAAQEAVEVGAVGLGQGRGVFNEEDLGPGDDRARDECLDVLPRRELRGAQVDALGQARDLEGAHEVVPVGHGAGRREGGQDVLADRQGLVQGRVGSDQRDGTDAAGQARREGTGRGGDDAAGLRLLEPRQDEEEGAGASARRIQDGAQRARAEPQVDARQEDDAGLVVRVGHAQARDLDASAAPLRGKGAAGTIPRARLGRGRAGRERGEGALDGRGSDLGGARPRGGGGLGVSGPSGGRQVGRLLIFDTVQVLTRVIRHDPILSASCRLCRNGAREGVGWARGQVRHEVACVSCLAVLCCKRLILSKSRLVSGSECSTGSFFARDPVFFRNPPEVCVGCATIGCMTYAANDKAIRYRVGIDVGLRSIGFCAVEVDEHDQPLNLLNSTVFIHDAGVDPNENKAAKSRKLTAGVARRTRRLYQTRRQRLARLDRVLANEFGWPIIDLTRVEDPREPWRVRAQLLEGYIEDRDERNRALSIAARHIARHRGWRNPYADVRTLLQSAEPSDFLKGLNERVSTALRTSYPADATPGQLVNAYLSHPDYAGKAGTPKIRGPKGILAGKLHQSDNAAEIRRICGVQKVSADERDQLIRAVFDAKSPKGSAKERGLVGNDELPGQSKHVRAEKAHPVFQRFRIVSVLANLRIREGRAERRLTADELAGLTDFLMIAGLKQAVTWQDLADNLGIERADLRGTAKASFDNSPVLRNPPTDVTTEKILACKVKWLKEWWKEADEEQRGYMVDAFSNSGGSEDLTDVNDEVAELLEQASEEDQSEFEKIALPQGRAAYSLDSLRRLTDRMLADGVDLHEARRIEFGVGDDWKPAVEPIEAPTGNPAVDRVLKQVSRWLHAATDRWGEPTVINIEHARDGLGSERVARELMQANERRRKANAAAVASMAEKLNISGKIHRSDQIRYFALTRQNCQCLYCGTAITYSTAEMDHIVPRADGSSTNDRSNLAAVCRTCNHRKGAIPFAVWATSEDANEGVSLSGALERVSMWQRENGMSPKQFKQLQREVKARLKSKKPDEEFDGRSMESVSWMAVELRTRVEGFYRERDGERVPSVGVYRGQLTAEARKASGFENRVNLIGGRGKTRLDRRHHAMDALVIALMNPSVSQTLALRLNMRDAQRLTGREETWKNFYGKPGAASQRFETWRESMLRAVELFNIRLSENTIPFVENIRLRVGSSAMHDATVHSFRPRRNTAGELIQEKGCGEQHPLSSALAVELIDRAETPALWTALTRCPDFDPKKGLPENPNRVISVNGTRVGPDDLLNFFGSSAACVKVRGGYAELGNSIHHARIYRIDGKKTVYAMVRVFQVDLLRLRKQDVFTAPLKPSTISMRTAEPKIRQALAEGSATQIGWLVEGDELQIETDKYTGGFVGQLLERYPEATSWRVAGFMNARQLRIKPLLLSKEGFVDESMARKLGIEETPEAVRKTVDAPGWVPAVNALLCAGRVRVVRRNCLGEERYGSATSLPVTIVLE